MTPTVTFAHNICVCVRPTSPDTLNSFLNSKLMASGRESTRRGRASVNSGSGMGRFGGYRLRDPRYESEPEFTDEEGLESWKLLFCGTIQGHDADKPFINKHF